MWGYFYAQNIKLDELYQPILVYLLIELQVLLTLAVIGIGQLLQARRLSIVVPPLPPPHLSECQKANSAHLGATLLSQSSKTIIG